MWHAWERGEKCRGCCWESPNEKGHLEDRGVDGRMGSKWIVGRLAGGGEGCMEWIHLAQDRNRTCRERGDEPSVSGTTELVI
jgi:hypothetical protein